MLSQKIVFAWSGLLLAATPALAAAKGALDVPPAPAVALKASPTVVTDKVALEFVGMSRGQPVYYIPELNMHVIRIPRLDEIARDKKAPKP